MKISKSTLYQLRKCGYDGLQIPTIELYFNDGTPIRPPSDIIELPDDYFQKLDTNYLPTKSDNHLLFLSRKGYEALKEDIKTAFLSNGAYRYGATKEENWAHFERVAEKHFQNVEKKLSNKIKSLEKKLEELKSLC